MDRADGAPDREGLPGDFPDAFPRDRVEAAGRWLAALRDGPDGWFERAAEAEAESLDSNPDWLEEFLFDPELQAALGVGTAGDALRALGGRLAGPKDSAYGRLRAAAAALAEWAERPLLPRLLRPGRGRRLARELREALRDPR